MRLPLIVMWHGLKLKSLFGAFLLVPKSVENVIVDSFELVKENYPKFILIYLLIGAVSVVVVLVFAALVLLGFAGGLALGNIELIVGTVVVGLIILFLMAPLWAGAYYSMVLQELDSKRVSIFDAIGTAKASYLNLLLTMFLQGVIYLVVFGAILLPLVWPVLALINNGVGTSISQALAGQLLRLLLIGILVFVGLLIAALVLVPLLYEATALVVLEGLNGVDAVRRSIEIGRENFWKIVWLMTVFGLAVGMIYVVEWIVAAVFGVIGQVLGVVVGAVLSVLVASFVAAWTYALQIVFYREFVGRGKRRSLQNTNN